MPAISPARLKRDVSELFEVVGEPQRFDRALDNLLDRYADRTYRKSQAGLPGSLLPAFHVPRPVLRQIELHLNGFAAVEPEAALALADRLWSQDVFEPKFLAVRILGALPGDYAGQVMVRLPGWLTAIDDDALQVELSRVGLQVDEAGLSAMLEAILEDGKVGYQKGLSALGAVAWNASPDALPGVYRLFGKALANPAAGGSPRLVNLARALANRSPVETAYFLRHQYLLSMRPDIARVIRQLLPLFPEQIRRDLRAMMSASK